MSLQIRLSKIGKKNSPSYRVVVCEKRSHRNGRVIETIGYYDPNTAVKESLKKDRVEYWKSKGANLSVSFDKILNGEYVFKKYFPRVKKVLSN